MQVLVGGGDDPDIHRDGGVVPHLFNDLFLEHPEQLGLGGHGQVPDLVQEDVAAVGGLEAPHPGAVGAGEGAFDVAEELALQ